MDAKNYKTIDEAVKEALIWMTKEQIIFELLKIKELYKNNYKSFKS